MNLITITILQNVFLYNKNLGIVIFQTLKAESVIKFVQDTQNFCIGSKNISLY